MQAKRSTTQLELFNDSPLDETSLFHDPGRPGFFSIFVRPAMADPRQRSYRLDLLPQVLAALDRHNDTYISQAEFFKPNRRLVNLWRLGLAFVDLDTYQTKWGSRTPEEVSLSVRTFLHDEGIPAASLIVSSGRGLYLKWLFETPIPQSALPRWNAVQRELVERLQRFGADPMAKDASRVLRLVQTVHAKTGDVVSVLHVEEAEWEPKRYGFDRLAGAVLPVERPQSQKDISRRPFKVVEGGLGRERSLAWARLTDLRLLQDIRGRVVPEGEAGSVAVLAAELPVAVGPGDCPQCLPRGASFGAGTGPRLCHGPRLAGVRSVHSLPSGATGTPFVVPRPKRYPAQSVSDHA